MLTSPLDQLEDPIIYEKFVLNIQEAFHENGFFSICGVTESVELLNKNRLSISLVRSQLSSVHCKKWIKMSDRLKGHILNITAIAMVYYEDENMSWSHWEDHPEVHRARKIIQDIIYPPKEVEDTASYVDFNSVSQKEKPAKKRGLLGLMTK